MNGNIDQTTESLKIEANGIMNNISFPNNISPRKKPWYAQQQLIIADDKFRKLKFGHFCKYFGIKYDTALRRKQAMETHGIIKNDGFARAATIETVQNAWKHAGYNDIERRKQIITRFPDDRADLIIGHDAYV